MLALWLGLDNADDQNQLAVNAAGQADDKAGAAKQQSDDVVAYLRGEQGIPGVPGKSGGRHPGPARCAGRAGRERPPGASRGRRSDGRGSTGGAGPTGAAGA